MIERLDGMTKDIVKDNIEKLKELFPTIVTDKKINFRELELLLGQDISNDKEQYSFVWNGKTEATKLAQKRSTGTLRPCKEESKNWDTTKNIYIEGDNLEALKLLQSSYNGKIKMIYIDPPYNTGHDFVYKDNFEDNIANYKEVTGQAQKSNADTDGRYHTNWLNMMYPRLKLARTLLTQNGIIFISIDDNEYANLKKICDDVFGEDNFVANLIYKRSGGRQDSKFYAITHEYVLCYAKNTNYLVVGEDLKEKETYPKYDEIKQLRYKTQLLRKWGSNSKRSDRPNLYYPIIGPDGSNVYPMLSDTEEGCWRWGKNTMQENIDKGNIEFVKQNNKWIAYEKIYEPADDSENTKKYTTSLEIEGLGSNEIKTIFGAKVFDYPKSTNLIYSLMKMAKIEDNDIVLDFFSGSATTANAIFKYNIDEKINSNFICIQLPELLAEGSEGYKLGYKTICDIGKERIRKSGDLIQKEFEEYSNDIGFKVFKLDSSNLKKWNNEPTKNAEEVANRIRQISFDYLENGRTEIDLVYEIMLKYGIDLTLPVTKTANGKGYIVNGEDYKLLVCSEMNIKLEDIEEFANESVGTYLFADRCFSDDNLLINTQEILKSKNKEMRLF